MSDHTGNIAAPPSRGEMLLSCLFLVLMVWLGSFFEFGSFSLYADDLSYLSRSLQVANWLQNYLSSVAVYSDGRPLQLALIDVTGLVISATRSFEPAYILLFCVTAASIVATWRVLRYRFSSAVALLAATILALSPLVSIRPFLNGIASPVTLLLLMLASLLYINGWRIAAYIVAVVILLAYELTFPVFVLLPTLLVPLRSRRDVYRLLGHALICGVLLVGYTEFRDLYGAGRLQTALAGHSVVGLGLGVVKATFRSLAFGLWGSVNLRLWLQHIASAPDTIVWAALAFLAFSVLLHRLPHGAVQDRVNPWQTVAVLLLLALSGYVLVYFGDPDGAQSVLDRQSRFHSVANLPLSVITALAMGWLLSVPRSAVTRGLAIGLAAAYLAVIFAFSISHQDEFAAETARQRSLVAQLVLDHPVMDPQASFVLVRSGSDWRQFSSIESSDNHSFYFLLPDLFDFDSRGDRAGPSIRMIRGQDWANLLTPGKGDTLNWPAWMWPPQPALAGHIWAYELSADGGLSPIRGPILVGGRDILHEGPDSADGVDLRKAHRPPFFDLFLGPQAAVVEAALDADRADATSNSTQRPD